MKRGNVRKFGRKSDVRKAMLRALMTAIIEHSRIKTTRAKAKTLTTEIAKVIRAAKKNNLASTRGIRSQLGETATKKLVADIGKRFAGVGGGYTRIIPLGRRMSDGSPMVFIEFTQDAKVSAPVSEK